MKYFPLIFVLILILFACNQAPKKKKTTTYPDTLANGNVIVLAGDYEVSLIRLIANPEKYDGKKLRLIGYLHLEFEGNSLFIHKEDYDVGIYKNSIWVDVDMKHPEISGLNKFSNHYVIIEGTFDSHNNGHMGRCSGSIEKITRLDLYPIK
ncbi:MAG TPA: hypothetical protein VGM63_00995 [Mucilaginibacter sp.]